MRVTTPVLAAIGALALAGGALVVAPAALATSQPPAAVSTVRSCARPTAPHVMACHSLRRTDIAAPLAIAPKASPAGYGPSSLQSAYNLTGTAASTGAGRTVAIVDAYDDPNAAADLATYRSQFGLPACTTSNGCFRKVSQNGSTSLPGADSGWAGEISLDLDMVSAVCPRCNILLVEANSANDTDLYTAEDYAAAHAGYVSNSWGGNETSNQTSRFDSHFNHPGVAITVSSGDSGTGAEYPATSRYVTAVGGTSLSTASNGRGWSEKAWTDAGSGCSAYDAKPSWQTANTNCSRRAEADVSAVADPRTGVAVYQTYGASGWSVYGGTSASAPIIAAVYALAGTVGSADYAASYPYAHSGNLNDVTSGANGSCGAPMCTSAGGWDGPSGLGTPNGVAAFTAGTVTPPPTTPPTTRRRRSADDRPADHRSADDSGTRRRVRRELPDGRVLAGWLPGRGDCHGRRLGDQRLDGPVDAGQWPDHHPGVERHADHQRLVRVRGQRLLQRFAPGVRVDHLRLPRQRHAVGCGADVQQPMTVRSR